MGKKFSAAAKAYAVELVTVEGLLQREAAQRIGCTQTAVSRWVQEAEFGLHHKKSKKQPDLAKANRLLAEAAITENPFADVDFGDEFPEPVQSVSIPPMVDAPECLLYLKGSYFNDQDVGGWACVLIDQKTDRRMARHGCENHTTPSQMELRAFLEGLQALKRQTSILVITANRALVREINEQQWNGLNWSGPWQELFELASKHRIEAVSPEYDEDYDELGQCRSYAQKAIFNQLRGDKVQLALENHQEMLIANQ